MRPGVQLAALLVCACGARAVGPAGTPPPAPVVIAVAAERGADLFASRGCAACHSIGAGLRVGPDLAGILDRREPEWVVAMITRPDSMLRHDPVARDLAAEYRSTMPRLGIGSEDARALLAYVGTREEAPPAPEATETRHCPSPRCGHGRPTGRHPRSGG
jgi:mono/diheme cytochrome c family protein